MADVPCVDSLNRRLYIPEYLVVDHIILQHNFATFFDQTFKLAKSYSHVHA